MTSKERVLAVVNGESVDRPPVDLWFTHEVAAELRTHFGMEIGPEMYHALGVDKIVWVHPVDKCPVEGGEGYICCSCHNAQAGTPLENIFAMIETVHEHRPSVCHR